METQKGFQKTYDQNQMRFVSSKFGCPQISENIQKKNRDTNTTTFLAVQEVSEFSERCTQNTQFINFRALGIA